MLRSRFSDIDMGSKSIIGLIAPDGGEIVVSNYMDIQDGQQYFYESGIFYKSLQTVKM